MKITPSLLVLALLVLAFAAIAIPLSSHAESMKHTRCNHHASIPHGAEKLSHETLETKDFPPYLESIKFV